MSIEFCEAVTAGVRHALAQAACAIVITGERRGYSPPASICCACSTAACPTSASSCPALSTMLATVVRAPQAGRGRDQRSCDRRRLRAGLRRRPAADGARSRPHRRDRALWSACRSRPRPWRSCAARPRRNISRRRSSAARPIAPPQAMERGFVHEIVAPDALMDRAVAVAKTLAALSPAGLRADQTSNPPTGCWSACGDAEPAAAVERSGPLPKRCRAFAITSPARCGSRELTIPPPAPARDRR